MTDLKECARRLGHRFRDLSLLEAALTHPSIDRPRGRRGAVPEYERLEFLGDRVLGLAVADHLYRAFPGEAEGGAGPPASRLLCAAKRWPGSRCALK